MKGKIDNKNEKVAYIYEVFKEKFGGKTDSELYYSAKNELNFYRMLIHTNKEKLHLKKFAKEYFQFRNHIIFTRNDFISFKQSEEYKKEKFLNKINFNKKLRRYIRLCDEVCDFEHLFYDEMGFSILKVENERWVEEAKLKEQSAIRYLN